VIETGLRISKRNFIVSVQKISGDETRVARWFIFRPKNRNLGKFGLAMDDVGAFYGHLVYFTAI
jgi:hypothetical protein